MGWWQVEEALANRTDVVLRIDVQGAATVRAMMPETLSIFLVRLRSWDPASLGPRLPGTLPAGLPDHRASAALPRHTQIESS